MSEIHEKVKAQFAKTSEFYVTSSIHAKGEDLNMMLELAGDVKSKTVLDVATGAGHTALAFAKTGARVTATDLTPEMLDKARAFLKSQNIQEVVFQEVSAEYMPFADNTFDIVTCRIAAHHFADPQVFVNEVARVLKPNGQFLLIDNIVPVDEALNEAMNYIEKCRDPSHVCAYSIPVWIEYLTKAKLDVHHLNRFKRKKDYIEWTKNAQTSKDVVRGLEQYILSLAESFQTYFEVITEGDKLISLSHEVMMLKAIKLI